MRFAGVEDDNCVTSVRTFCDAEPHNVFYPVGHICDCIADERTAHEKMTLGGDSITEGEALSHADQIDEDSEDDTVPAPTNHNQAALGHGRRPLGPASFASNQSSTDSGAVERTLSSPVSNPPALGLDAQPTSSSKRAGTALARGGASPGLPRARNFSAPRQETAPFAAPTMGSRSPRGSPPRSPPLLVEVIEEEDGEE